MTSIWKQPGVYYISHRESGMRYIGSTIDLGKRLSEHRLALKAGRHINRHLQRAWNKYGADAFEVGVLERCDRDVLIERENYWIEKYKCNTPQGGYNIRLAAETSAGVRLPNSTRQLMSAAKKGKAQSPEHARNQCAARTGAKRTVAQLTRISAARREHSPEKVVEIYRLLAEHRAVWGKHKLVARLAGVKVRYVDRLVYRPPQWVQRMNDSNG